MASAIERLRTSYRIRGLNAAREISKRQHTMFQLGACAILGAAEAKGHKLPEVMGVDGKVAVGVGCLIAAGQVGPDLAKYMQALADGLLAQAAYEFGKTYGATKKVDGVDDATSMDALLSHVAQGASSV